MNMFETPEDRSYLVTVEDGVLTLTFNRPEAGNAIDHARVPDLTQMLRDAKASDQVRCLLVRGEGRNLAAGGDNARFARTLEMDVAGRQADFTRSMTNLRIMAEAFLAFDGPVVTAMRGAAAGAGLLYPLGADYVVADHSAIFLFVHQNMGLCPDNGVSALLPQLVGPRMARRLMMTTARVKAEEALALGLVDKVVSAEELDAEALAQAKRFAGAPQVAVKLMKKLVNESSSRPLLEQLKAEADGIVACVGDEDFREGVRAFQEKRPPKFPSSR
jgi:2-(1,2-epoxy-1,2-dihydrophenyl)acetyl-CoA isomerase